MRSIDAGRTTTSGHRADAPAAKWLHFSPAGISMA
jgi:hypothetical protein